MTAPISSESSEPLMPHPILKTPLEIYDATTPVFASARLSIFQENPLIIDLRLIDHRSLPQIPSTRISNAVKRQMFVATIQNCVMVRMLAESNPQAYQPHPLDSSLFSRLDIPLSNWPQFSRLMYKREEKVCTDVIQAYLRQEKADPIPDKLQCLGLAPGQVKPIEEDALYFSTALKGLILSGPQEDPMVKAFKHRYPEICMYLATNEARSAAAPQEGSFTLILNQLRRQILGQDPATELVASSLARMLNHENKVFLFVGPTGTGKTELAKVAATLKGSRLITFSMEQFAQEYHVSTFFGSAAGLVGSSSKPQIATELENDSEALTLIEKRPESTTYKVKGRVLLFDEFEKAHRDLQQSLLTFFDEGKCVVRYTQQIVNVKTTYQLENCIIICTSNLFQDIIVKGFQDHASVDEIVEGCKTENQSLHQSQKKSLSPEMFARLRIVPFGPIPSGEIYQQLIKSKLRSFLDNLKTSWPFRDTEIRNESLVLTVLEERLYGDGTNIRKVKDFFDRVQTLIVKNIEGRATKNMKIILEASNEARSLCLKFEIFTGYIDPYVPLPIQDISIFPPDFDRSVL